MKHNISLFLKGVGMGAADVVPGVSGGTIAFITGIYDTLINSIKSILSKESIQYLLKFDLKSFWNHINGMFLLILGSGIITSVLSLSKIMKYLLKSQPVLIWSFFFGLIVASSIVVGKKITNWSLPTIISGIIGIIIAYTITVVSPAETPIASWFIFLSGAIAICAMILPGISGSFILLLLSKYEYIISAISDLDLKVIFTFGLGCLTGILSFSNVLHFLLKKYYEITIALLTGFMIGSLNKVWPWKETVTTYIDRHGIEKPMLQDNILPIFDENIIFPLFLMLFGFFAVILVEKKTTN